MKSKRKGCNVFSALRSRFVGRRKHKADTTKQAQGLTTPSAYRLTEGRIPAPGGNTPTPSDPVPNKTRKTSKKHSESIEDVDLNDVLPTEKLDNKANKDRKNLKPTKRPPADPRNLQHMKTSPSDADIVVHQSDDSMDERSVSEEPLPQPKTRVQPPATKSKPLATVAVRDPTGEETTDVDGAGIEISAPAAILPGVRTPSDKESVPTTPDNSSVDKTAENFVVSPANSKPAVISSFRKNAHSADSRVGIAKPTSFKESFPKLVPAQSKKKIDSPATENIAFGAKVQLRPAGKPTSNAGTPTTPPGESFDTDNEIKTLESPFTETTKLVRDDEKSGRVRMKANNNVDLGKIGKEAVGFKISLKPVGNFSTNSSPVGRNLLINEPEDVEVKEGAMFEQPSSDVDEPRFNFGLKKTVSLKKTTMLRPDEADEGEMPVKRNEDDIKKMTKSMGALTTSKPLVLETDKSKAVDDGNSEINRRKSTRNTSRTALHVPTADTDMAVKRSLVGINWDEIGKGKEKSADSSAVSTEYGNVFGKLKKRTGDVENESKAVESEAEPVIEVEEGDGGVRICADLSSAVNPKGLPPLSGTKKSGIVKFPSDVPARTPKNILISEEAADNKDNLLSVSLDKNYKLSPASVARRSHLDAQAQNLRELPGMQNSQELSGDEGRGKDIKSSVAKPADPIKKDDTPSPLQKTLSMPRPAGDQVFGSLPKNGGHQTKKYSKSTSDEPSRDEMKLTIAESSDIEVAESKLVKIGSLKKVPNKTSEPASSAETKMLKDNIGTKKKKVPTATLR